MLHGLRYALWARGVRRDERSASILTTISRIRLHVVVPQQAMGPTADGVRPGRCPPKGGLRGSSVDHPESRKFFRNRAENGAGNGPVRAPGRAPGDRARAVRCAACHPSPAAPRHPLTLSPHSI
ncbi:hypothetical protein E2651_23740 [Streptomyces sp. MZ04]|nr:hypothetical protein E2651_23740 [Streptomyces sp. MZ04]